MKRFTRLINAGRAAGAIPSGPPARTLALALVGAVEGAIIQIAGQAPHDVLIAERVVLGLLGLQPERQVLEARVLGVAESFAMAMTGGNLPGVDEHSVAGPSAVLASVSG